MVCRPFATARATAAGAGVALALAALAGCGASHQSTARVSTTVSSGHDHGTAAIARCLERQGWDVEVDESDNSLQFQGDKDQMTAYDKAYSACSKRYGDKVVPYSSFSTSMWRKLYAREKATAACLRQSGVQVPSVPSFDTYVQRYPTDPWTAYSFVDAGSQSRWAQLNRLCPQPDLS